MRKLLLSSITCAALTISGAAIADNHETTNNDNSPMMGKMMNHMMEKKMHYMAHKMMKMGMKMQMQGMYMMMKSDDDAMKEKGKAMMQNGKKVFQMGVDMMGGEQATSDHMDEMKKHSRH